MLKSNLLNLYDINNPLYFIKLPTRIWILFFIIFIFLSIFIYLYIVPLEFNQSKINHEEFENKLDTNKDSPPPVANPQKWIILLTTCVPPFNKRQDETEHKYRTELYRKQIQNWLDKTNYPIFVVESSNNTEIFTPLHI